MKVRALSMCCTRSVGVDAFSVFLAVLVGFIVLLAHRLVFEPPEVSRSRGRDQTDRVQHTFWRYLAQGTLAVALVTLVLFFASGMYEERIRYANRSVHPWRCPA